MIKNYFITPEYKCNYLPEKKAKSKVLMNDHNIRDTFSDFLSYGYRRSGHNVYIPNCKNCNECIPIRININKFFLQKSHKRLFKRNKDLKSRLLPLHFDQDHFQLYQNYQNIKHPSGGMNFNNNKLYCQYLLETNVESKFLECRKNNELKIVCIFDIGENSLSAVYTFYDPFEKKNSLGTFSILKLIKIGHNLNKKYLYLGYYIKSNPKMSYKVNFNSLEFLIKNQWTNSL
jgi:arginine-tRNA-protein transferase